MSSVAGFTHANLGRLGHACPIRRQTILVSHCVAPLLQLFAWNGRFARLWPLLAEKEVLVAATTDLQVDHMAHVFEIFQLVHIILAILLFNCLFLLLDLDCCNRLKDLAHIVLNVPLLKSLNRISSVVISRRRDRLHRQLI